MSNAALIHYGPVWNKPRKQGESFAACDSAGDARGAMLTTHEPWITCQDCQSLIEARLIRGSYLLSPHPNN